MSELMIDALVVEPGFFSDEILSQIIRTMALCGDPPIAQLAQFIRNMRKIKIPLESRSSSEGRTSYDRLLCCDLYVELFRIGAIREGQLDLELLRGCWRQ
jgi:hypothetical protein